MNAAANCLVELFNKCFSKISLYPCLAASLDGTLGQFIILRSSRDVLLIDDLLSYISSLTTYIFHSQEHFPPAPPVCLN